MDFYVISFVQREEVCGGWRISTRENTRNDPLTVTFKKVAFGGRYIGLTYP